MVFAGQISIGLPSAPLVRRSSRCVLGQNSRRKPVGLALAPRGYRMGLRRTQKPFKWLAKTVSVDEELRVQRGRRVVSLILCAKCAPIDADLFANCSKFPEPRRGAIRVIRRT